MRLQMPELPCFKPRAKVGDVVYYISLNNRYAVKRASVVEIQHSGGEYRQVMSNGDVVVKDAHSLKIIRRLPGSMMLCSSFSPHLLHVSMFTRPVLPR